jgi:hypothetical protein
MTPHKFGLARRSCAVIGFTLLVGLSTAACDHRAAPMTRSVPVALTAPPEPKALESAIEVSLARRHWQIKEHQPGKYVAELSERGHSATIAVLYDGQSARVDYVDSQGLMYAKESNGEVIHRSYNTWVKSLANDIKVNLSQAQPSAASASK